MLSSRYNSYQVLITPFYLRFFVGYGLELSRLVPLVIFHLKKKFLCKTEAEVKEAWAPGDFSYGTRVPNDMLIMTVVLCYSVIAPLIIPFGVVYFSLGWLIARNQVFYIILMSDMKQHMLCIYKLTNHLSRYQAFSIYFYIASLEILFVDLMLPANRLKSFSLPFCVGPESVYSVI